MISLRAFGAAVISGLLFVSGWIVFVDAQLNTLDKFSGVHVLPPLGVTLTFVFVNMVSPSRVATNKAVKTWLLLCFTLCCVCVGSSIWIVIREYPPPVPPWPGVSILVQNVCVMVSTVIFFVFRKALSSEGF